MTKIATNTVAKASVAFVTVAMMFTLVAPAKAATTAELEAQIAALLAQIATLQAQMGGGTTMTCDVPAQPLTIGSRGAGVTALQNLLINAGEVIPAGATGYFGSQTQAALASWQAANGVSPAVGYYGPITKSAMESSCVVTTPDDGDDDGDMTDDGGLGSDEGDINSVDEKAADESTLDEGEFGGVLAFEVEIEGDVELDRMDFYAARTTGTDSNDADDYFDSAALILDGDVIEEIDVDDFDQDDYDYLGSSDEDDYRLRFSNLGLVFEDGDTPEFQVAFQAAGNIDSADLDNDWTVALQSIRFVDGQGFTDTWSDASVLDVATEEFGFGAEEVAQWSITTASDDPDATTFEIDTDDESEEYTVFVFEIEEENGVDSTLEDIRLNATTTGSTTEADVIDEIRLYHNGDLLASESPSSGTNGGRDIDFENLDVDIDADATEEFEVRMIFKGTDDHGAASTVTVGIDSVRKAKDANGNDEDDMTISGTPESETHTLRADGIEISEGSSDSATTKDTNGDTAGGEEGVFTVKFDVTAFGDDIYIPKGAVATSALDVNDGVGYQIEDGDGTLVTVGDGTGTTTSAVSTSANTSGNYYVVEQGDTESFTLNVTFDPDADGYYHLQLTGVNFNVGSAANADTTESAVPAEKYETDNVDLDA